MRLEESASHCTRHCTRRRLEARDRTRQAACMTEGSKPGKQGKPGMIVIRIRCCGERGLVCMSAQPAAQYSTEERVNRVNKDRSVTASKGQRNWSLPLRPELQRTNYPHSLGSRTQLIL